MSHQPLIGWSLSLSFVFRPEKLPNYTAILMSDARALIGPVLEFNSFYWSGMWLLVKVKTSDMMRLEWQVSVYPSPDSWPQNVPRTRSLCSQRKWNLLRSRLVWVAFLQYSDIHLAPDDENIPTRATDTWLTRGWCLSWTKDLINFYDSLKQDNELHPENQY